MTRQQRQVAIRDARNDLIRLLDDAYKTKRYEDDCSPVASARWKLGLLIEAERLEEDLLKAESTSE